MREMVSDPGQRAALAGSLGDAINSLVREHYTGLLEEPDITSRIGQRLEDQFDGKQVASHTIRVITQILPSHGPNSLEKPLGTDLYIALTVEPANGAAVTKGLLIQAKRQAKLGARWSELQEQCRRMNLVTQKGSVVWLYGPEGVATMRAPDVVKNRTSASPLIGMLDDVLRCWIGDKRKVPTGFSRPALSDMLRALGTKNGVLLKMTETT